MLGPLSLLVVVAGAGLARAADCPDTQPCTAEADCPSFKQKKAALKAATRGSPEYKQLRDALVSSICNRAERKVCCDRCTAGAVCTPSKQCGWYTQQAAKLKQLNQAGERTEAAKLKQDLVGRICNKEQRTICCPTESDQTQPEPTQQSGQCGLEKLKASNVG